MRTFTARVVCIASLFCFAINGFAFDFSAADKLFDKRGEGVDAVMAAVKAYDAALKEKNLLDDEIIHATENLSQLWAYRANLIPRSELKNRAPHYQSCMDAAENLKPGARIQTKTAAYYFWYGACFTLYSEAKGPTKSLRNSGKAFKLLEEGNSIDPTYEGGGFNRVLGGLYTKLPAFNPFGPAGNTKKALTFLERSLESPAFGGSEEPETSTGEYFFETYWYYAQALDKDGQTDEAVFQIEDALERISDGDIPGHRKPETMVAKGLLENLKNELSSDD